ncbi:MAG TPA: hypothetical protein VJ975_07615 [Candidatus Limnocylindria bacterium]|nr:hypothetical protein [Candidatus Limnocylindria bacterium]
MKKLFALLAGIVLALGVAGIAIAADGDLATTGRVVFVTGGDVEVAAGEQADAVIVVSGDVEIAGTVNGLVVIDGTARTSSGATLDTIGVVNGAVELSGGTTVLGDVLELNSTVDRADGVAIGGAVKDIASDVAGFALFMGFAALAIWIGVGIATILGGLLMAGLAARQTRSATSLISREPGTTFLVGLLAIVVTPIVAGIAMVTIIGIPAGFGLLLFVWPTAAFIGYIVAAIWLGEWLLGRRDGALPAKRPYAAATIGLLVAFVIGLVPVFTAVLSLFGLGAVVLAAWRTLRGSPATRLVAQTQPTAA